MRKSVLTMMLVLVLPAVGSFAAERYSYEPFGESFGYSSDEFLGGGSYLGVDTRNVTSDRLGTLKLKDERGVEVTMVDQDAPAGKAGLKEHDVILTVNGTDLESVEQLRRMIRETPPSRVVTLGISRDGQPLTMKVQLADRKKAWVSSPEAKEFNFTMPPMPQMPDIDMPVSVVVVHSSMRSGLMVENLTPQLGDFFGARNGEGVLVRSVDKGSRAERAFAPAM
jgi:membrane-associated protease RseP (regulator of RpoE activity)